MARILLIEDSAKTLTLLTRALQGEGHAVAAAADGHEGLRLLARESFDLVLTEIVMPRRDGIEVLRAAQRLPAPPKVIVLDHPFSGTHPGTRPDYLRMALELGADRALARPLRLHALEAAVDEVLHQSLLREAV